MESCFLSLSFCPAICVYFWTRESTGCPFPGFCASGFLVVLPTGGLEGGKTGEVSTPVKQFAVLNLFCVKDLVWFLCL